MFSRTASKFRNTRRLLSTISSQIPGTRTSKLPNGLTIATEYIPNTSSATVGIFVDAGSRAENVKNNGTAHFLEHLAFKGTQNRSQQGIELEIENIGSHLNAYTSRENTVYYAKSLQEDIPKAVDILSDILTKSVLDNSAIERERDVIIRESEEVDKMYDEVVFDHLHEITYKDQPLGRTILGPIKNIKSITRTDLKDYITKNYKGDRMVLAGAGAVDHEKLVQYAQKYFGHVPKSESPVPLGSPRGPLPVFCRGERFIKENTLPTTHIAIALEGVSWSAPDYFVALATQAIVGNWDRAIGTGTNSPSPLAVAASQNGSLANSYMSFSTSYADSGLWGMYIVTDSNEHNVQLIVNEILKEWKRIKSGKISDAEVNRAKAQLKAALLLSLDGSTAIVEDIGRQVVTTGKRLSPEEVFEQVDKITKNDIIMWANYRLQNKPVSMVALGNTSTVPNVSYIEEKLNQ
ncbi:AEG_G0036980.mRNA.1.CDS.1 [Saccharomyces cerevisiae]|nr:AEG_G0036980.mRNA.1.CDS.1 [Saccharomyces cerevisiae]CAI4649050.1 AKH_1a_G0035880.mRNA.1.CDS.1 [Saccharomyces cerevisiae]CAI6798580.1 AKH_1a_G0035880.mRNA.1.CDS.1 [Saccharomyces cerevisiae]CAI6807378.1 AEG_G0036980.mRNA.1.CDS.1 [Saccharomyces cerevisiae]